jgi:hypothetical protein
VAGTAELVSTLDFAATSVDPATAAVLPVLSSRADEAFFLVSDGTIPPQQGLYRLPEPGAGPAGGAAGAALIALLARRRATRRR